MSVDLGLALLAAVVLFDLLGVAAWRTWSGLGGRAAALRGGTALVPLLALGVGWPAGLWLASLVGGTALAAALLLPAPGRLRAPGPLARAWARLRGSEPLRIAFPLAALLLLPLAVGGLIALPSKTALVALGVAALVTSVWYGRGEPVLVAFAPPALGGAAALGALSWAGHPLDRALTTGLALGTALGLAQALALLDGRLARWRGEGAPDHADEAPLVPGAAAFLAAAAWLWAGAHPALGLGALAAGSAALLAVHALLPPFLRATLRLHGPSGVPHWRAVYGSLWLVKHLQGGSLRFRLWSGRGLAPPARRRAARDLFHEMGKGVRDRTPGGHCVVHDAERIADRPPGILVANHASLLDVALIASLPLRLVILVKEWVWKAPMIGPFVQAAGYLNVDRLEGEALEAAAREVLASGAWILVFPEGSRTRRDGQVGRFHNGAFALARALGVQVTPLAHAGSEWAARPGTFWTSDFEAHLRVLDPLDPAETAGEELPDRALARRARDAVQAEVDRLWRLQARGTVWPTALARMYRYLGPVASHYAPAKARHDPLVTELPDLLDAVEGEVLVAGCGLGIMTARLSLARPRRAVRAVDSDPRKLALARAALGSDRNVTFVEGDLREVDLGQPHAALLVDVLHYWPHETQLALLRTLAGALAPGGLLLLRDGVRDAAGHALTRRSERFALALGFTRGEELVFRSRDEYQALLREAGLVLEVERSDLGRASDALLIARKPDAAPAPDVVESSP